MVAVCTARRIARSIASSVCKKPMASSIASAAPTDIDQLLLDGTNAAHYTTAEWAGYEHLLKDQKTDVGTLRTPRAGRCWLFDGTNDYGTITNATLSDRTNPLTITAWIKTTSDTTNQTILGCGDASLNNAYALTYGYTDGKLEFWHDGSVAVAASSIQSLAGSWHHVAVVRSGSAGNWTITFYVDGVAAGNATTSTNPNGTGTQVFSIGRWGSYAAGLFFSGSIRDVRVYSAAKNATEVSAIYNQADTPGTYDTTGLLAGYWCEEESGTTGYDWSGNGRHLTLTNITQASFHAADTGVTYSDANVRGYRLSGSVYIPATSSTLAADGNALTVTGRCPQPGHAPQKCIKFDGTDDYASRTGDFRFTSSDLKLTIAAWIKHDSISSGCGILATWTGATGYSAYVRNDILRFYKDTEAKSVSVSLSNSVWYWVAFVTNGTSLKCYLNGVQQGATQTWASAAVGAGGMDGRMGWYSTLSPTSQYQCHTKVWNRALSDSEIANAYAGVLTGDEYAYFPMCEGPGSSNTNTKIYDVSGNGRHLTITNATLATFWGNNTDYTCKAFNYPLRYGYTIDGSGVIVPAELDGLLDAAGNAIGQAAGGWASGLQNLNCLPYTNPLGVSVGLETSLDPTADRKTTSSSKRRRRNTSGRYDRFGARATAMSDASSNAYFGD